MNETVVVVLLGGLAVPGLEQAHHVLWGVGPPTGRAVLHAYVVRELLVVFEDVWLRQVTRQQVVEGGDIGAALDAGVTPKCEDPAARPADVAQELLEDGRGTNDLDTYRMLGPRHRVGEGGGALPTGVVENRLGYLEKAFRWDAADTLDHIGCVARVVSFENLQHAPRILKCWILGCLFRQSSDVLAVCFRRQSVRRRRDRGSGRLLRVLPAGGVVLAALCVEPREEAIQILGVYKGVTDEGGRIGVITDVLAEKWIGIPPLAAQDVIDESAEKRDIGARS